MDRDGSGIKRLQQWIETGPRRTEHQCGRQLTGLRQFDPSLQPASIRTPTRGRLQLAGDLQPGFGFQNPRRGRICREQQTAEVFPMLSGKVEQGGTGLFPRCLLYTSPSPRDQRGSRMPSSA